MGLLEVEILGIKKGTTGEIVISELRKITQLWKHIFHFPPNYITVIINDYKIGCSCNTHVKDKNFHTSSME